MAVPEQDTNLGAPFQRYLTAGIRLEETRRKIEIEVLANPRRIKRSVEENGASGRGTGHSNALLNITANRIDAARPPV
jgi:hypothetical protein